MSAILSEPALDFRPMQPADLTEIMEIERRSYPHPWTRLIFSDCLHAGYSCWVCERQGIIQGYGILSIGAGEAHLLNLCVCARSRNDRGSGRNFWRISPRWPGVMMRRSFFSRCVNRMRGRAGSTTSPVSTSWAAARTTTLRPMAGKMR